MNKITALLLTLVLSLTALTIPGAAADFTDVPAAHSFHDAIADCASRGITGGYPDGSFRPGNTVTRSNFAVMLSRAFYPEAAARFNTPEYLVNGPFYPNCLALYSSGILDGVSFAATFPQAEAMDQGITRYDMAMLLSNILKDKGVTASESEKNAAASTLADFPAIPAGYQEAVQTAFAKGLIGGYSDGSFHGERTMNRGQAAVVIYRMWSQLPAPEEGEAPAQSPAP